MRKSVHRGVHTSVRLLDKPSAVVDSIIRVDHAGELGADRIYAGQMAVLGNSKVGPVIKEMWEQEKHHKAKFEELIVKHRVRPTALTPFWNVAGFALGAGTALLGEKAAMACTVAVESVIVEHYNDQLRELMADETADKELLDTIKKFRDEEQEHHDCGLHHGAEQAPFYEALSQVIKLGCRAAISMSKGLLEPSQPSFATCRHYSTAVSRRNPCTHPHIQRSYSSGSKRWHLASAVCLERKPVISQPLTPFEQKYMNMLAELELNQSIKSDHELRLDEDQKRAVSLKESDSLDSDMETALKQSGQDFEDAGADELAKFTLASREGSKDVKSHKRQLDKHLVLLTKVKLGNKQWWLLPQDIRRNDETLRQTADRVLIDYFGSNLKAVCLGNAPFGFYKYLYPKTERTDADGVKVFMFKAIYEGGLVDLNQKLAEDYLWATRGEMKNLMEAEKYRKSVLKFLIEDDVEEETAQENVRKSADVRT